MASNQSWKWEDLQDLGLAEELQSGLYLSEFGSDSMKEIIQSLMQDDEAQDSFYPENVPTSFAYHQEPSSPNPNLSLATPTQSYVTCILRMPTACTAKSEEPSITYLNRGQSYCLTLTSSHLSDTSMLKSTLAIEFHDLRLRNSEEAQIQQWIQGHPGQRMIEIDFASCDGISNIEHDGLVNMASFMWSSQQQTVIAFKIHSLSSEFTVKKHGGEKGIPFRLVVSTYTPEEAGGSLISKSFCLIKVFKDKGADRKHKQDLQKRERLPPEEAAKYWESHPVTRLEPLPLMSIKTEQKSPQYCSSSVSCIQSPPSGNYGINYQQECVTSPTAATEPTSVHLTNFSNVDETRQWLQNNRFAPYSSLFVNYGGADLLRLSRKDLMDLCGPADGIRLYNAIHTRSVKTIYISLEEGAAYHAIFLETLTANHFKQLLASKLSILPSHVTALHLQHTYGMLVNVDDLSVQNMYDEQCFIVQPVKEEQGTYQLILKIPSNIPYTSAYGSEPRS